MPLPGENRPLHTYTFGAVIAQLTVGRGFAAAAQAADLAGLARGALAALPLVLSNYGTDGGLEFSYPSDRIEHENSADGYVTVSAQTDERVELTIRLKDTSAALPYLEALLFLQAQFLARGLEPPRLDFEMLCPSTGDQVLATPLLFLSEPGPNKARNSGEREFRCLLPYGRHKMVRGTLNPAEGTPQAILGSFPFAPEGS